MHQAKSARGHKARRRGKLAEDLACWWLRLKGYRILARNWRSPHGEIDILARHGSVLAVIEVKRRAELHQALEALLQSQRQRLHRALMRFLQQRPELQGLDIRFDLIAIGGCSNLRHTKNAWRIDSP